MATPAVLRVLSKSHSSLLAAVSLAGGVTMATERLPGKCEEQLPKEQAKAPSNLRRRVRTVEHDVIDCVDCF
jgi:hypothetical protein